MEIIRAEQRTISLSSSFRLDVYRLPNGEIGIATEVVKKLLGYGKSGFKRLLQKRNNKPIFPRSLVFRGKSQVVLVQSATKVEQVSIISMADFNRLIFSEVSRGNEQARRVQSLLAKTGFWAYVNDETKVGNNTNDIVETEDNTKRDLLEKRYEATQQKVIESMKIDELGELETEEDILSVAVSLTF